MANVATTKTRLKVTTYVTVPVGETVPSVTGLKRAFRTGLRTSLGKLQLGEAVMAVVKAKPKAKKPKTDS